MTDNEETTIKLTNDETLVLFEFPARFNSTCNTELFEDQAEQKTLWIIEGQLEKILVEPFLPNYTDIILEARNKIRDPKT
jgi:peroxiredoxin